MLETGPTASVKSKGRHADCFSDNGCVRRGCRLDDL